MSIHLVLNVNVFVQIVIIQEKIVVLINATLYQVPHSFDLFRVVAEKSLTEMFTCDRVSFKKFN
jgi:hypothetical protein